jgi:hypothetical protein
MNRTSFKVFSGKQMVEPQLVSSTVYFFVWNEDSKYILKKLKSLRVFPVTVWDQLKFSNANDPVPEMTYNSARAVLDNRNTFEVNLVKDYDIEKLTQLCNRRGWLTVGSSAMGKHVNIHYSKNVDLLSFTTAIMPALYKRAVPLKLLRDRGFYDPYFTRMPKKVDDYLNFQKPVLTFDGHVVRYNSGSLGNRRRFIVAPSGSGKTFVSKDSDVFIDADTLFEWPSTDRWWEDETLATKVNENNKQILAQWLSGDQDGKMVLYADDLGLDPDGVVLIDEGKHQGNLRNERPGQPGIKDWPEILKSRHKLEKSGIPIYNSFDHILTDVRSRGYFYSKAPGYPVELSFSDKYYLCTMSNLVGLCEHKLPGMYRGSNQLVYTNIPLEIRYSTTSVSQSRYVAGVERFYSRKLYMSHHTFLDYRKQTYKRFGFTPATDNKSGYKYIDGKKYRVKISGHMISIILQSGIIMPDYNAYLRQIETNLFPTPTDLAMLTELEKNRQMDETSLSARRRWHGVDDYILAIYTTWRINVDRIKSEIVASIITRFTGRFISLIDKHVKDKSKSSRYGYMPHLCSSVFGAMCSTLT